MSLTPEQKRKHAARERARRARDPQGHRSKAKKWLRAATEADPAKIKAQYRAARLRCKYKMTLEDYERLLASQCGLCAICRRACLTGRNLAVDHSHSTGEVRGLLCASCNIALGGLLDSPDILSRALAYLEWFKVKDECRKLSAELRVRYEDEAGL